MKPRDYQQFAIDATLTAFKNENRATIVMACGTGKTLVALWIAEALQSQTILVLMPSLLLIKQTIEAWTSCTQWTSYTYMAVCSDTHIVNSDTIDIEAQDCCFDVCTNAESIKSFLQSKYDGVRIVFCTYQSSKLLTTEYVFDLAICDEAHKVAQKNNHTFNYCLDDKNIAIKKRLFLTATPRIYSLRNRNVEKPMYSMDNKEKYGSIVYNLSFSEAIERNIICDYKVLVTFITDDMIQDIVHNTRIDISHKKIDTILIAHLAAMNNALCNYPINKGIAFVKNVKETKKLTDAQQITRILNVPLTNIDSYMPNNERKIIMENFKNNKKGIISNARCLSEGVDIPQIELVAFLSPKESKIDIIQALGRVLRKNEGKEYGYILLPLYIKDKTNIESTLETSDYKFIKSILSALRYYDIHFTHYNEHSDMRGKKVHIKNKDKIEFNEVDAKLKDIISAIQVELLSSLQDSWNESLKEALVWKEKNGSWIVKHGKGKNKNDTTIIRWMNNQRHFANTQQLSQNRIDILRSFEFPMNSQEAREQESYSSIKNYIEKHTCLPSSTEQELNVSARNWLLNKRKKIQSGHPDAWAEKLLQLFDTYNIQDGITIKSKKTTTELHIQELEEYYKKHGHTNVRYSENRNLNKWIRKEHKTLTEQHIKRLDAIGYAYTISKDRAEEWERLFQQAKDYKHANGSFIISKKQIEFQELRRWIVRQRSKYKNKGVFQGNQLSRLATIGILKKSNDSKKWKKNIKL